jgi:hypothetical protein
VACALLRRDNLTQPCVWHGVLADVLADVLPAAAEDPADADIYSKPAAGSKEVKVELAPVMVSIAKIKALWHEALQTDMGGNVLSALCTRFGPAWRALQEQLDSADRAEYKADRSMLRKKSYESFSTRTVLPTLTLQAEVDVREVVAWLQATEQAHEMLELQISRSAVVMEPLRQDIGTPQLFTDMCRSMGMPGVSGREVLPLCRSAMLHAHLSADMPCPVEVLEKFCMDRVLLPGTGSKARPMLMSLLRPKQHEQEQLLKVLSNRGEYGEAPAAGEGKNSYNDGDEKDRDSDTNFVRTHAPPAKHLLVLLSKIPRSSSGTVSVAALVDGMREQYAHLDEQFITSLTGFWVRGEMSAREATVAPEVVHAFFCPGGLFSVRVRTPMNFGFKIGRPLKPTDPTEVVYQATIKQMFARLKTLPSVSRNSRVPGDVKLYADAEMRRLIPRSKTVFVGNQVCNTHVLCVCCLCCMEYALSPPI